MKKIYKNSLIMLVAGALVASCADYNVTDNFTAFGNSESENPYKDYAPVKSYIDRETYPNMKLGATLKVAEFNKQELAHAAAMTNFDDVAFGTTLMSGNIVSDKGLMNFLDLKDLLDHVEEIGGEVFGSPIAANANQADGWLTTLTSPIEIKVSTIEDKTVDYTKAESFTGTALKGTPYIKNNYDGTDNALAIPKRGKVYIVEGFEVDTLGTYTITFYAKVDKDESVICTFAGNKIEESGTTKKYTIKSGKWVKVVVEGMPASGVTDGYLMVEGNYNSIVYVKNVTVTHTPDNHRAQTAEEKNDTIRYAMNAWCDGLMKINAGRIKSFDLIDEPIDAKSSLENGYYDLKHSTTSIYWQDILGSENYAPAVASYARKAYETYGNDPSELKFFIAETGLDDQKKLESLKYWINVWDANGAKIDGINAKLSLTYSEDAEKQAANEASLNTMLDNLAATGKMIRLSNFDIKYQDATGTAVTATDITDEQRQKLADFYAYAIKSYMTRIPNDKQAGICKGNMVDTSDPVGLWSKNTSNDWVRTATYKAFCDALSGK